MCTGLASMYKLFRIVKVLYKVCLLLYSTVHQRGTLMCQNIDVQTRQHSGRAICPEFPNKQGLDWRHVKIMYYPPVSEPVGC